MPIALFGLFGGLKAYDVVLILHAESVSSHGADVHTFPLVHIGADMQPHGLSLAMGFRQSASTLAKRLGMGRFQQADLRIGPGRVLAVAAGPTVMMLAIAGEPEIDIIIREARNHIAAWTAQAYQAQEWVRA